MGRGRGSQISATQVYDSQGSTVHIREQPKPEFSLEELVADIDRLSRGERDDTGYFTVTELIGISHHGDKWFWKRIRILVKAGILECGEKIVLNVRQKEIRVNAYRFKQEPK